MCEVPGYYTGAHAGGEELWYLSSLSPFLSLVLCLEGKEMASGNSGVMQAPTFQQ